MENINYLLIMLAALFAIASPGPATLAIASASMSNGRSHGLAMALGILTGSLTWSCVAAFGFAAILSSHVWLVEVFRYLGASYLLFLAYKSIKSATSDHCLELNASHKNRLFSTYLRGLLIHLTNPKAILFFAALFSIGVPNDVSTQGLISVILAVSSVSFTIFISYALLFSIACVRDFYLKARKTFEFIFAAFFGFAGLKILLNNFNQ